MKELKKTYVAHVILDRTELRWRQNRKEGNIVRTTKVQKCGDVVTNSSSAAQQDLLSTCYVLGPILGEGEMEVSKVERSCFMKCSRSRRRSIGESVNKNSSQWEGSVQSLSHVRLFVTTWTAAHQASLSITSSQGVLKLMSVGLVMKIQNKVTWVPRQKEQ